MKKAILLILTMILISGCAGFKMDTWVGYRKLPPPEAPTLASSEILNIGWTDLIKIITPEQLTALLTSLIPENSIVGIGAGLSISVE